MSLLNTPIKINKLNLSNRLVMPPMATAKSDKDGYVTKQLCDYYNEKSKGGYIGLIITEHSYVSLDGKASINQLSLASDDVIPNLQTLTDTIHKNGSKVFAQINHAGSYTSSDITGCDTISASNIKHPCARLNYPVPKEMNKKDIDRIISDFTNAAIRAKKANYDGIEIHSAHRYLLNQFYSPLTNHRLDEYCGNTIQGRIKLHLDIIQSIRKVVGKDYPIALRLGGCDYMENGITIQDSVIAAKLLENAGLDLLDISGGFSTFINPYSNKQGYFSEISEKIKEVVSIPVILTGGIIDPKFAEQLLQDKKADMIGVGRAILKDSSWAKKAILEN